MNEGFGMGARPKAARWRDTARAELAGVMPLMRAQARVLVSDVGPLTLTAGLLLVFAGLTLGDTPPRFGFVIGAVFAAALGLHVRGAPVGPAGSAMFNLALPALPVSASTRRIANVLLGESLILGATLTAHLLAFGLHNLTDTQVGGGARLTPDASLAVPLTRLLTTLLTNSLLWAPILAATATSHGTLSNRSTLLFALGMLVATVLDVGRDPLHALVWCVVATTVVLGGREEHAEPDVRRYWMIGQGLSGMLLSHLLITIPIAVTVGVVVTVGFAAVGVLSGGEPGFSPRLVESGVFAACALALLLPVLPSVSTGGGLLPVCPEVLSRLPVTRGQAVAGVLFVAALRVLVVAAPGALLLWGMSDAGEPTPRLVPLRVLALVSGGAAMVVAVQLGGLLISRYAVTLRLAGLALGAGAAVCGGIGRPSGLGLLTITLSALFVGWVVVRVVGRGGRWGGGASPSG